MGNMFAGVAQAKTSERGAFCNPGLYKVEIKRALLKHTRKGYDAFIVEVGILESNYNEAKKDAIQAFGDKPFNMQELDKTLPNKSGSTASWFQSLADKDIGYGSLLGFMASIMGQKADNEDFRKEVEKMLEAAVNEGLLDGWVCPLEVVEIKTKRGTPFSLYKWGTTLNGLGAATP